MPNFSESFWRIGYDKPVFIIAEAGVNHNGDLDTAKLMVKVAAESGANAIKFQTYDADSLVSKIYDKEQWEMLTALQLSHSDFYELKKECEDNQIIFLSSLFDKNSLVFLYELGVEALKIPSGEITNFPLIDAAASTGLPLIVSTGMSNMGEINSAVQIIFSMGNKNLALLHCLSCYPAPINEVNLRAMSAMAKEFNPIPIGFSDHTDGILIPIAAAGMGACVIEKHFTLDRRMKGPDHLASLEPSEFKSMVCGIRLIEMAMGDGVKVCRECEKPTALKARKSLVAAHNIEKDVTIIGSMIDIMRPGTGMYPYNFTEVLGKKTKCAIKKHEMFSTDNIHMRMN